VHTCDDDDDLIAKPCECLLHGHGAGHDRREQCQDRYKVIAQPPQMNNSIVAPRMPNASNWGWVMTSSGRWGFCWRGEPATFPSAIVLQADAINSDSASGNDRVGYAGFTGVRRQVREVGGRVALRGVLLVSAAGHAIHVVACA
jgi:hypothetical protein